MAVERRVVPEWLSERFERWVKDRGWKDPAAAAALETSTSMVRKVRIGARSPGRRLALTIERLSAGWADGPIRATEWDATEALRERSGKDAA